MDNEHIEQFIGSMFNHVEEEEQAIAEIDRARKERQGVTRKSIIEEVRAVWPKIAHDAHLRRWVVAYLYWNVPKLSVTLIEQLFNCKVLSIAQELQLHGNLCRTCSNPVYINSRSQLSYDWLTNSPECKDCQNERLSSSHAEHKRQMEIVRQRIEELRTMPYGAYLATSEWIATRTRMLKRAGFRCQLCNKQGRLNVHHRTYERRGQEDYKDLIVLCGTCHAKFHDKIPQE